VPGLILNLKPWERFLVGDAVLQNGNRRTQLRIADDRTGVLRLSDALHPDDVCTPLTRAYYAAQLLVLGKGDAELTPNLLKQLLDEAKSALHRTDVLAEALHHAAAGRYYKVLRTLRPHLPSEVVLLSSGQQPPINNPSALKSVDD